MQDEFQRLIPEPGASAAELRIACEQIAARARAVSVQRDDSESFLRLLVLRQQQQRALVADSEWEAVKRIALRNSTLLRGPAEAAAAFETSESVLIAAAKASMQHLSGQAAASPALQCLRRALIRVGALPALD